jgi:predicted O-methyltransferase YrrM
MARLLVAQEQRVDHLEKETHAPKRSWTGGTTMMNDPQIRPLRWLGRLVLGIAGLYFLTQVIGRIMRRVRPGLTPLRAIPSLNMPLRWKFFGTPEQILDRAGISPGMRVLEIGPGPGFVTVTLAQRVSALEGGSVTCVEIQPEMIALLRERLQTAQVANVEVLQGDGRQLPLPESRFDVVLLIDVVGETPDELALFQECARVLKPGGVLAVTEQLMDPDFRLPRTTRKLASKVNLLDAGHAGWPWWTYTVHFRKPM